MGKKKAKVKGAVAAAAAVVKEVTLEEIQEAVSKGQSSVLKKIFHFVEQNPDQKEAVEVAAVKAARDAGKDDLAGQIERRQHDGPNYNAFLEERKKEQERIDAEHKKQIAKGSASVFKVEKFDENGDPILTPIQQVEYVRGQIRYLISNSDQEGLEEFLEEFQDPSFTSILKAALEISVQEDSADFVKWTISKMKPNTLDGEISLHNTFFFAIANGKNEAAKALARVENQGDLGLNDVMRPPEGHAVVDVNQGATFFHRIVDNCQDPELIKILLDRGANYMVLNKAGQSPLSQVLCGKEKIAKLFIDKATSEELSSALAAIDGKPREAPIRKGGEILGLVEFDFGELKSGVCKLLEAKFKANFPSRSTSPVAGAAVDGKSNEVLL